MTCSQLIVNWLLGSLSDNVPPLWTLSSKEVNHIKNGMKICNMMKCFMSEFKRVVIEKVSWKSKIKDWDYMSAINVWDNVQNGFNIKYMANNKRKKETSWTFFTIACHLQISFRIQRMHSFKNPSLTIIQNKLKIQCFTIVFSLLCP